MTALTELLAKVERGHYAPDADYKPKRYSAFADDMHVVYDVRAKVYVPEGENHD